MASREELFECFVNRHAELRQLVPFQASSRYERRVSRDDILDTALLAALETWDNGLPAWECLTRAINKVEHRVKIDQRNDNYRTVEFPNEVRLSSRTDAPNWLIDPYVPVSEDTDTLPDSKRAKLLNDLYRGLRLLPLSQLRTIDQLYWQDRTVGAIAKERGVTQGAISRQRGAAVRQLHAMLTGEGWTFLDVQAALGEPRLPAPGMRVLAGSGFAYKASCNVPSCCDRCGGAWRYERSRWGSNPGLYKVGSMRCWTCPREAYVRTE